VSLVLESTAALCQLKLDRLCGLVGNCVVLVLSLSHLSLSLALIQEESTLSSAKGISVDNEVDGSLKKIFSLTDSVNSRVLSEVASYVQILPGDHVPGAEMLHHSCSLIDWQILHSIVLSI
jgi:hypothetical protein